MFLSVKYTANELDDLVIFLELNAIISLPLCTNLGPFELKGLHLQRIFAKQRRTNGGLGV